MDDKVLANYIPSYGDRIALLNFCKSKRPLSNRKKGLLDKLREKMKSREENSQEKSSTVATIQTKKKKQTRNIELGWIHNNGELAKQVKTKQDGGTRKIQISAEAGIRDILQEGKTLFSPSGTSPKGLETNFEFELWDFKQNCLTDETFKSVATMYEATRLTMLRFYIVTKAKEDADDEASETSEVILVSENSTEISEAETVEVMWALHSDPSVLESSGVSEVPFGPIFDVEGDTDETLIYEGVLQPYSPDNSQDVETITIHNSNTLQDMIAAFSDDKILSKTLQVKRILPHTSEEAGSGSGLLRCVLSCFWHEFYERCTLGGAVMVPFISHDFSAEIWKAVGRILLKGYQDCQYFPNQLALPFLEEMLFKCVYSDLKIHFLQFVSTQECEVLLEAVKDFSSVDTDDLREVLDCYNCWKRITAETCRDSSQRARPKKQCLLLTAGGT
ncbi:uncharacterized protein LOC114461284 isoform X2 [Gouania willdenowi]|nr:uncharacterized protein LOC114461284 isoform X2 [Gouania willdenowi]XP_028299063.1 uncharacterized protein LOC114461284 isoform X2 [Gouania willdenowi]